MFIYLIATIILVVFSLNVEIFKFEMQTNFSIYWRLKDLLTTYTATILLLHHCKLEMFHIGESLIQTIIEVSIGYIAVIIFVVGISMIHGYIVFSKYLQIYLSLAIIVYWTQVGIGYFVSRNDWVIRLSHKHDHGDNYGDGDGSGGGDGDDSNQSLTIHLRELIISRTFDAVIWFCWQLAEQIIYSNKLKPRNVTKKWIVRQ